METERLILRHWRNNDYIGFVGLEEQDENSEIPEAPLMPSVGDYPRSSGGTVMRPKQPWPL